jgi:uncharacterized protein (TIGR00645 family)
MTSQRKRLSPSLQLVERWFESGLFGARWLMAPFYLGLVGALAVLLAAFVRELLNEGPHLVYGTGTSDEAIMFVLTLVDLTFAGNLLIIVIFSGYENFISKIETSGHQDRPDWMGNVDFSGLKIKLIASIVAISAISLLKTFMRLDVKPVSEPQLVWQVAIHGAFVVTGAGLALMDWLIGLNAKKASAVRAER